MAHYFVRSFSRLVFFVRVGMRDCCHSSVITRTLEDADHAWFMYLWIFGNKNHLWLFLFSTRLIIMHTRMYELLLFIIIVV